MCHVVWKKQIGSTKILIFRIFYSIKLFRKKWNVFVTLCQDGFSTSTFSVCWLMCSAWWQNLACDSYQECGWVEPIPSSGSGHWPVSRPSSIPVGNDTLYRCCGGRRFRRDDGGQGRTTSDKYLKWRRRSRPILKAMEREVRIWADTVAGELALKIYGSSDEMGSQDLPRCVRHFGPNVAIVMWTFHWIYVVKLTNIDKM